MENIEKDNKSNEIDSLLIPDDDKTDKSDADVINEIKEIENKTEKKKTASKVFKAMVITALIGIFVLIFALIVFIFKLDGLLFPSKITGTITDYAGRTLQGAKVCVHASCTETDNSGIYSIDKMVHGTYELSIQHKNFFPVKDEVTLVLGQTLIYDKSLQAKGVAEVIGILQTKDASSLETDGLKIFIESKEIDLKDDNSFAIQGLPKGKYLLEVITPYYIDYQSEIELGSGMNTLEPIILEPAMEIHFTVVDWFSKKVIGDAGVIIDTINYKSNLDGKITIKNLKLGKAYSFSITKEQYNEKDIKLTDLKQGKNTVDDQEMVPEGRIVYVSNRTGNQNLYAIDYDGENEQAITNNTGENYRPIYSSDFQNVYFLSTKDGIKDTYGNTIALPYSANLKTGSASKLAKTNYSDFGSVGEANYKCMKRAFVKYKDIGKNEVYFGNLDGGNTKFIGSLQNGTVGNYKISNDGKYVLLTWYDYYSTDNSGVYHLSTESPKLRKISSSQQSNPFISAISDDNQTAIIEAYDQSANRWDLWSVNIPTGNMQRLTNSITQEIASTYSPDNKYILYISNRDGNSNAYRINTNGKNEVALTAKSQAKSSVTSFITGPNNTILYIDENSLWIASINNSFEPRKIKDNVSAFDYSYHEWW